MSNAGLFIGRFQPFHKGHLNMLHLMAKAEDIDRIIIGIGSSQYSHTYENPFTADERCRMIINSLAGTEEIVKAIVPKFSALCLIPDLHDYPKWIHHVRTLCPMFDIVYSGNTIVKELFTHHRVPVRTAYFHGISGTDIRNKIVEDKAWTNDVPNEVFRIITEIGGIQRIKDLSKSEVSKNGIKS